MQNQGLYVKERKWTESCNPQRKSEQRNLKILYAPGPFKCPGKEIFNWTSNLAIRPSILPLWRDYSYCLWLTDVVIKVAHAQYILCSSSIFKRVVEHLHLLKRMKDIFKLQSSQKFLLHRWISSYFRQIINITCRQLTEKWDIFISNPLCTPRNAFTLDPLLLKSFHSWSPAVWVKPTQRKIVRVFHMEFSWRNSCE